jgi:hypothetical protein
LLEAGFKVVFWLKTVGRIPKTKIYKTSKFIDVWKRNVTLK